jgi:hypothetical protein
MPFALYGLNRFVTTGSKKALVGGTASLVMQNWSCGYYLLYFAPSCRFRRPSHVDAGKAEGRSHLGVARRRGRRHLR